MRAKITEIREYLYDIDPENYPEEVNSWEEALEYDLYRRSLRKQECSISKRGEIIEVGTTRRWR